MYNAEIKEKFIHEFSNSISRQEAAESMFKATEKYEQELNTDICSITKDKLQKILEDIVGVRSTSYNLRIPILKQYIKWCKKNNINDVCEDIFLIEDIGIDKMRRQTVANPQHLQRYLDSIFDPEEEETIGCTLRCYFWLAYMGMDEEDAFNITTSEVDLANMVIKHNDREYIIYRESIPAFRNCVRLKRFRYKHPNHTSISYKDRAPGDCLLRGVSVDKPNTQSFRVEISRRKRKASAMQTDNNLDLNLSFSRVWMSGIFYRMLEWERAGNPVDFFKIAVQFTEGKTYKLSRGQTVRDKQRRLAKYYLNDYNRWKEAYSV